MVLDGLYEDFTRAGLVVCCVVAGQDIEKSNVSIMAIRYGSFGLKRIISVRALLSTFSMSRMDSGPSPPA